jgi:hypothetical protein
MERDVTNGTGRAPSSIYKIEREVEYFSFAKD